MKGVVNQLGKLVPFIDEGVTKEPARRSVWEYVLVAAWMGVMMAVTVVALKHVPDHQFVPVYEVVSNECSFYQCLASCVNKRMDLYTNFTIEYTNPDPNHNASLSIMYGMRWIAAQLTSDGTPCIDFCSTTAQSSSGVWSFCSTYSAVTCAQDFASNKNYILNCALLGDICSADSSTLAATLGPPVSPYTSTTVLGGIVGEYLALGRSFLVAGFPINNPFPSDIGSVNYPLPLSRSVTCSGLEELSTGIKLLNAVGTIGGYLGVVSGVLLFIKKHLLVRCKLVENPDHDVKCNGSNQDEQVELAVQQQPGTVTGRTSSSVSPLVAFSNVDSVVVT